MRACAGISGQQYFITIPLFTFIRTFIRTLLSFKYYAPDTRSSFNICHIILTPVPYSISTSDAMQVSRRVSLSVKWYNICLSRDSNQLSHDPEVAGQNMWIKSQRPVCMTRMTSIMNTSLALLLFVRVKRHFQLFFSHITTGSGCDRELSAHFYCVALLTYHAPDT